MVRTTIETEPRVRVDYVSVVDAETLEKLDKLDERPILIAVAAYVGKTRLIDNMMLNKAKKDARFDQGLERTRLRFPPSFARITPSSMSDSNKAKGPH